MATRKELTEQGRSVRAEYLRKWRKKNLDKCREYSDRYWSKRGEMETQENKQKESVIDE